jgi:UDP-N-acetylmuramoyl-L-alanyl-D-glutamate--2,6-diaminopimelate ligase
MPVIGITGTSGKTSTTHFIAQIASLCHHSCGIIGTLGVGFLDKLKLQETYCTTPNAVEIQDTLAQLDNKNADMVAMEVTSHALEQHRVEGVHFNTAIFTNLTRDHLDYHKNMEEYWLAKKTLFTDFQPKFSIINVDDEKGRQLVENKDLHQGNRKVFAYSTYPEATKNPNPNILYITTEALILNEKGIQAQIKTPWGEGTLSCPIVGRFNLSNLLAAITALCLQHIPLEKILEMMPLIKTVPGRMMRFGGKHHLPLVIVDYAHKPDALAEVLTALRAQCRGKLWCVFGCGGDRDRGKRPLMAANVENLCDYYIMTQDNSRTEDPEQIFNEMLAGLKHPEKAIIEWDRKKAIHQAIMQAKSEDVILIAGKGHEKYQIIGINKNPFSDQREVQEALKERVE